MDEKLTIKVNLVDRFYPLKIDRKDEEKIRKAAKKINDTVIQYRKVYVEKDSQDFLAMAALQFATKIVENEDKYEMNPVLESLEKLDAELAEFLQKE